jgi:beta-lactamase regulating signal transducer with metallopeptidase domain
LPKALNSGAGERDAPPVRQWPGEWAEAAAALLPWTAFLWLLGVMFFSARLVLGWRYTRRLRSCGARPPGEGLQVALRQLGQQLGIARAVRLWESALVSVPTAIGWLRPVILLPASALTGLTRQQLEAIIAHELAHIRRHDYLINLLQAVIETLLFYHPAVWWVSRQIRQEREHCCDDLAVAVCGDALGYARALFTMEQLRAAAPPLVMAANGGTLMNRIERLVGVQTQPQTHFTGWLAGLLIMSALVSVGIGAELLQPKAEQRALANQPEAKTVVSQSQFEQTGRPQKTARQAAELAASRLPVGQSIPTLSGFNDAAPAGLDGAPQAFAIPAGELPDVTPEPVKREQKESGEREEKSYRFELAAGARVEVSYILGLVEIEAADGNLAEIQVSRSANTRADLERFDRINVEQTGAGLQVRGEDSKSNGIEIRHHLRLRLPRNCQVSLWEVNGRVHIDGIEGAIQLKDVNGGADIPRLSGELKMDGINGDIKLGVTRLAGKGISIRDANSDIELQLAGGIGARLEIIELEDQPLIEIPQLNLQQTGEKKFEGQLGAGGPLIRIMDVNGQLRIRHS